ncbi:MAG: glycosyltransferase family 2 protein [Pseudomonadota bacterium]
MTDAPAKPSITVIILSFNEAVHIGRCIERLLPLVERVVVIDSFSTDRTVEIARSLGAEVFQNPWKNHAAQFAWGLEKTNVTSGWTMRIDCDEYLETGLQTEIISRLQTLPESVTACDFKLKVIFKGKFIRWGGFYATRLIRLWRTGFGQIEQRWMDERIVISSGERISLGGGDLVDENLKDIGWWTEKHNGYATRHMIDFINREHHLFPIDERVEQGGQNAGRWKRFLRNRLYGGAPLYVRAILYFIQRYFFRLGFLDGKQGFVWHFLQGFWYFVLMDAKIDEARGFIRAHGVEAFRAKIAQDLGIDEIRPAR